MRDKVDNAAGKPRIVVVGGGFAGLNFIKKIDRRLYEVILVDSNNYNSFPPLFYQVASGGLEPASICFPFRRELRRRRLRGVKFNMGRVKRIDLEHKTVSTDYETLRFDKLVIAAGTTNNFFGNYDLVKRVYTLKSTPEAIRCRNDILDRLEQASLTTDKERRRRLLNFVVVGGGPTGVEIAGALGEMKRYMIPRSYPEIDVDDVVITIVEGADRLLKSMSEQSSAEAARFVKALMVDTRLGVNMKSYDGSTVTLSTGETIEAGMVIWTAGVTGVDFEVAGGQLPIVKGNRVHVDSTGRAVGLDDVYALGDIAWTDTDPAYPHGHPQLAQVAIQQARNLARNINDSTARPFVYDDKGSMATIGRNRAVVELPHARYSGFFAWLTWMFVHLISLLGMRNKVVVFYNWLYAYFSYGTALKLLIHPSRYPLRKRWSEG